MATASRVFVRDLSDVRDVAKAYAAIVAKAPAGATLNICSGTAYSLEQVLGMMAKVAGYIIDVRVNPAFVRSNEVKRLVGSNARLRERTGVSPIASLEDTLHWMYS